ncbi:MULTISPECIES: hypothetical protein [unclassified Streptomyces]|uniref:hypothetical protein n=1 Tax=unclassified Streptomyces TaxID=2593676 RepID=UPI0036EC69C1
MRDATTGPGAEGPLHGDKLTGTTGTTGSTGTTGTDRTGTDPTGRGYGTGARSADPQDQESAPLVAGHDTAHDTTRDSAFRDTSDAAQAEKGDNSRSPLVAGENGHERAVQGEGAHRGRLLPHDEIDKLSLRLQHAVAGFVDGPRTAVEEADHVMEEIASRLTDALTHRRRTLRTSWQQDGAGKNADAGDTEQLRLALRDYRELADRLLHL